MTTPPLPLPTLRRQFAYDAWANREALGSLARMAEPPVQAVRWLAHVAGAKRVWWERLQPAPQAAEVWPAYDLDACARALGDVEARWAALVDGLDEAALARTVRYANTRGEPWQSTVGDMAAQVLFHGAYHRGQLAAAVRAAGGTPALTDFIHAVRSGAVE